MTISFTSEFLSEVTFTDTSLSAQYFFDDLDCKVAVAFYLIDGILDDPGAGNYPETAWLERLDDIFSDFVEQTDIREFTGDVIFNIVHESMSLSYAESQKEIERISSKIKLKYIELGLKMYSDLEKDEATVIEEIEFTVIYDNAEIEDVVQIVAGVNWKGFGIDYAYME